MRTKRSRRRFTARLTCAVGHGGITIMKNWILGISLAANVILAATFFTARQYERKIYHLSIALAAQTELHINEHLLSLITSDKIDEAKSILNNFIKSGKIVAKTLADIARWQKIPYTPKSMRDMESQLNKAAETK